MTQREPPTLAEFSAMTLQHVEAQADELPMPPARRFVDWLMERNPPVGSLESEGVLWRRLAKRMRRKNVQVVEQLGEEVDHEWHPRLMTEYSVRERPA